MSLLILYGLVCSPLNAQKSEAEWIESRFYFLMASYYCHFANDVTVNLPEVGGLGIAPSQHLALPNFDGMQLVTF